MTSLLLLRGSNLALYLFTPTLGFGFLDRCSRRDSTSSFPGVVRHSRSLFGFGFLRRSTAYVPIGVLTRLYRLHPWSRTTYIPVGVTHQEGGNSIMRLLRRFTPRNANADCRAPDGARNDKN